jgi:predicted RecB family nuclease
MIEELERYRGSLLGLAVGDALGTTLEYLIGTVTFSAEGTPVYESIWSFDRPAEKRAFQTFIDTIKESRPQYPDMHIYHYAPYEPTAIKHLAGRHGICTDDVDELLRAEVFVDLFRVVRQGRRPKKSIVHRYQFPAQDHTIDRAHEVHDPRTKKTRG